MQGVLGMPCLVRQDIAIGVGVDQRIGFRWKRSDGTSVNLSGYTGTVRFESEHGETWATLTPQLSTDGLCEVVVTPADTAGAAWLSRYTGRWAVTLTSPTGKKTCLASGYLTVTNMGVR